MKKEFWGAYGDVLCDKYGWLRAERKKGEVEECDDNEGSAKDLGDVPIAGTAARGWDWYRYRTFGG